MPWSLLRGQDAGDSLVEFLYDALERLVRIGPAHDLDQFDDELDSRGHFDLTQTPAVDRLLVGPKHVGKGNLAKPKLFEFRRETVCHGRLTKRIEAFVDKYKKRITLEDRRRYVTAMQLLQERVGRAEKIDMRLTKRAEV